MGVLAQIMDPPNPGESPESGQNQALRGGCNIHMCVYSFIALECATILFNFFPRCEAALKNSSKNVKSLVLKSSFINDLSL